MTHRAVITPPSGLLSASCLKEDMAVLKINNVSCKGLRLAQVVSIICQTDGPLAILADEGSKANAENLAVAEVVKPEINSKVGLGMTKDPTVKIIGVTWLDGLFPRQPFVWERGCSRSMTKTVAV